MWVHIAFSSVSSGSSCRVYTPVWWMLTCDGGGGAMFVDDAIDCICCCWKMSNWDSITLFSLCSYCDISGMLSSISGSVDWWYWCWCIPFVFIVTMGTNSWVIVQSLITLSSVSWPYINDVGVPAQRNGIKMFVKSQSKTWQQWKAQMLRKWLRLNSNFIAFSSYSKNNF